MYGRWFRRRLAQVLPVHGGEVVVRPVALSLRLRCFVGGRGLTDCAA